MQMKTASYFALTSLMILSNPSFAMGEDDPLVYKVTIDQFEKRLGDGGDPLILEAEAWVGYDLNKLWVKADVEQVNSTTEESELQLLYSRAVDPNWDLQVGWRHNIRPTPSIDWLALGFNGIAPYFIETDAALFFGEKGQINARARLEYELMLTQKLVLTPELGMNFYSKDDPEAEVGPGLSDLSLGLRLGYEIRREFAPYFGVSLSRKFGGTAVYAREHGGSVEDTRIVLGVRAWF